MSAWGIDLGTTNSVISRLEDGRPVAVPVAGHTIVPSVVIFDEGRVIVGREARNLALLRPERTVRSVKRRMGTDHRYELGDRVLSPEDVSAEILRELARGASESTGEQVRQVVITVPAYFDDAQRRATLAAGEKAGLEVLRLLNEPTSASLVYDRLGAEPQSEAEIALVYDLGGGTFDVSVLEVFEGVREVRSTAGNSRLGGDDFDELLLREFLDSLKARGIDPREDARAMARLVRLAEDTKIRLSSETVVQVREEFLTTHRGEPVHLELAVTRRRFEELVEPLLRSTVELAKAAVAEANLQGQALGRLLLVGGSTRIPLVRQLLEDAFEAEVHEEIDPDLAVGLGASVQAGLLTGVPVERLLVDVSAHTLGILVLGPDDELGERPDTYAPMIRRNTVLPTRRAKEFYTAVDGQRGIEVEVYQGEEPKVSRNTRVGSFSVEIDPMPAPSPVTVEFEYDLNGVVQVSVLLQRTGKRKTVALKLSDAGALEPVSDAMEPEAPAGAIERKARAILARDDLADRTRIVLDRLLARLAEAKGDERIEVEEQLLDLFFELEDEDEDEDDDEEIF